MRPLMQVFAPIGAERNPCPCVSEAQRFQFLGGYRFAFVPGKEGTDHFMAIPSSFFLYREMGGTMATLRIEQVF